MKSVVFPAYLLLVLMWAPWSAWASNIMTATDCNAIYWGTRSDPDYRKAFDCYQREGVDSMLAVQTFNGEGTRADPDKALELAKRAAKNDCDCDVEEELKKQVGGEGPSSDGKLSLDDITLIQTIQKKIAKKRLNRIDISDILLTQLGMNFYMAMRAKRAAYLTQAYVNKLKGTLSPQARAALEQLLEDHRIYVKNEALLETLSDAHGSIRPFDEAQIEQKLEEAFQRDLKVRVENRQLLHRSNADWQNSDRKLNVVYRLLSSKLKKWTTGNDGEKGQESFKTLETAERSWIKNRDDWTRLLTVVLTQTDPRVIEASVKGDLTEQRISALGGVGN